MTESADMLSVKRHRPDLVTEQGTVISVCGDEAWVQTLRQSACQSCSARHGCGQKALAAMSSGQSRQLRVSNTLNACPGDEVTVAIAPASLLQASLLVYALPLLLMVMGVAVTGQLLPGAELPAMMAALVGLGVGLLIARRVGNTRLRHFQPMMVARLPSSMAADTSPNPTVF